MIDQKNIEVALSALDEMYDSTDLPQAICKERVEKMIDLTVYLANGNKEVGVMNGYKILSYQNLEKNIEVAEFFKAYAFMIFQIAKYFEARLVTGLDSVIEFLNECLKIFIDYPAFPDLQFKANGGQQDDNATINNLASIENYLEACRKRRMWLEELCSSDNYLGDPDHWFAGD